MRKVIAVFVCLFAAALVFAGGRRDSAAPSTLRFGLIGDTNSLPLILAEQQGYFEQEGVQVQLIQFNNAQERDAAIQAGQLDGVMSDLLAAAFLAAGGFDFRITSLTDGRYGIVASPQSGITSAAQLRDRRIGLSVNTVIQYTVDAQLGAIGIPMGEYETVAVPNQNIRLNMVLDGTVDAGGFPDPFLTAAVVQGAVLVSTTDSVGVMPGVILFSQRALNNRLEDVRAFYRVYYRAAQEINADPDTFRRQLVEHANFPEIVRDTFDFVTFSKPTMVPEQEIVNALDWLRRRDLLQAALSPADLIDTRAINEWLN